VNIANDAYLFHAIPVDVCRQATAVSVKWT